MTTTPVAPGRLERRPRLVLVAMNYAPEPLGTAPYTTTWAQHLATWADVLVLAGVPHYPQWRVLPGYGGWRNEHTEYGVRVRRLRHHVPSVTTPAHRLAHESSFAARILGQRVGRLDGVLAVSPPLFGAAAAARLARRHRVPFGLVVQDLYGEGVTELGHAAGRGTAAVDRLERRTVRAADAVLTISGRFADRLASRSGIPRERVAVVGNWSHLPAGPAARDAVRARHGWGREFVVLHAGNMGAKQRLDSVIDAARLADARAAPVRFVLVGDGNRRAALVAAAAGVARMEVLPTASPREHAGLLAAADVLLVNEAPGVAEMSLPSKLTSYFAAGRPVLAATGADGATAQVLRRSGAGVRVAPGDPPALLAAALDLRERPGAAAAHADLARRWSRTHHGVDEAMHGYDDWVATLLVPTAVPTTQIAAPAGIAYAAPRPRSTAHTVRASSTRSNP